MKYKVYGIGGDGNDHMIAECDSLNEAVIVASENEGNYLLGTNIVDENGDDVREELK